MGTPMELAFHTLDVFTDRRFAGNPLAVVHGADGLDTAAMQTITREFNLSETVFVLKPENPSHSAKIRIFTPASELPFAGHPTIGTAVLLAELRAGLLTGDADSLVVLEENIGVVRVGVRLKQEQSAFAEFDAPKLPEEISVVVDTELLAAAVGLEPREIGFSNHRPTQFSAGVPFTFLPVSSLAAVARAEVQSQRWAAAFGGTKLGKMSIYTQETINSNSAFHARVFAPAAGVAEKRHQTIVRRLSAIGEGRRISAHDDGGRREDLSWKEWGKRLSNYIKELEALFWPELIIIGGGVSAKHEKYFEFLQTRAKLVPAEFLNQAGIAGAAIWGAEAR